MIRIVYKNKEYLIKRDRIMFVLSKLHNKNINENKIIELMEKYRLFDESFLENVNKI